VQQAVPLPGRSRRAIALGVVVLALVLVGAATAVAARRASGPRTYIVVLRDDADPQAVAREHAAAHALDVTHVYEHALKGYAASIPADRIAAIRADPRVQSVEQDAPVRTMGAASSP
jgi:hypothetical protein